jgi:hypothetical protein
MDFIALDVETANANLILKEFPFWAAWDWPQMDSCQQIAGMTIL